MNFCASHGHVVYKCSSFEGRCTCQFVDAVLVRQISVGCILPCVCYNILHPVFITEQPLIFGTPSSIKGVIIKRLS